MQNLSKKITALLGPTNTGKTHDAIEKMLEFDSGIFGLPLRLLAREVYEKCLKKNWSKQSSSNYRRRKNNSKLCRLFCLYSRIYAKR